MRPQLGIRCKMNFAAADTGEHEGTCPLILKGMYPLRASLQICSTFGIANEAGTGGMVRFPFRARLAIAGENNASG